MCKIAMSVFPASLRNGHSSLQCNNKRSEGVRLAESSGELDNVLTENLPHRSAYVLIGRDAAFLVSVGGASVLL